MPNLLTFATAELATAKQRKEFAQEDLATAQAALAAAKGAHALAGTALADNERLARKIRQQLAQIPMPADGGALLAELETAIIAAREAQADVLDAEAHIDAEQAKLDRAGAGAAIAAAASGRFEAEVTATKRAHDERERWRTAVAGPLATLPDAAGDAIATPPHNAAWLAAKAKVEAAVPAALLTRARARAQRELDRLASARSIADARKDAIATELAASGGLAGATAEKKLAFERAEAALRAFAAGGEQELLQARALLDKVAAAPALTAAVKARIAALEADAVPVITVEQDRDTAQAAVDTKQAQLDARIETVRDAGGDVATDAQIATLTGELTTLTTALVAKQDAYDAVKSKIDLWEAAVPESAFADLLDLDEAKRALDRLAAADPAALQADFDSAESDYASALADAAAAGRKLQSLEAGSAIESRRVDVLVNARRSRLIVELRGDR